MLAFGGIFFFIAVVAFLVLLAWVVVGYFRGTEKAVEEGIDRDTRVEPLDTVE